jgi:hypothetical protein
VASGVHAANVVLLAAAVHFNAGLPADEHDRAR